MMFCVWKSYTCEDCLYNIDDECRRHPPLIRAFTLETYTDYPCILDCTGEYTKACAEFKWVTKEKKG